MSLTTTTRARVRTACGAVLGVALATCVSAGMAAAPASASASASDPAYLRAAHLVPGLGEMDIRLAPFTGEGSEDSPDDNPLVETEEAYGGVGDYQALPPGDYAVSVRPAGSGTTGPPLLSLTLGLEAGGAYTVAGLGSQDEPRLELLEDDLTPPGDGRASVRLLAASSAAPRVDVFAEGGPVLASDATLGRPTGYSAAPAGPWTVRADGETVSGSTDLVLDSGTVYTLLVLDASASSDGPAGSESADAEGELLVRPVVDAVGAGVTPSGGAAAGFGGAARQGQDGVETSEATLLGWPVAVVTVVLALTAVLVLGLRRSAVRARTRHVNP